MFGYSEGEAAMKTLKYLPHLIIITLALVGCSDNNSSNEIVQNGGTILISLGAREELGHKDYDAADITAKVIGSGGGEAWIKVRNVFPLNTDPTSSLNHLNTDVAEGYGGFWFAVLDMEPVGSDAPTTFNPGEATIEIHGLPSLQTKMVKILPGEGKENLVMSYDGLPFVDMLRPAEQVKFVFTDPSNTFTEQNLLGAIEFNLAYPADSVSGLPPARWPRGVSASNDENLSIQSYTTVEGETNTLHILIMNPAGIGNVPIANKNTLEFYQTSSIQDIRVSIVYPPEIGIGPFFNSFELAGYYISGAEVDGSTLEKLGAYIP